MKHLKPGQRVKIIGAKNIYSKFGIIDEELFFGAYFVKVGVKHDRERSLLCTYADGYDHRPILLGEEYLQPID